MVFNLADMANMMGIMIPGKTDNNDIYGAVYNTFGSLQHKYYPGDLVSVMPYEKAVDKTALFKVISGHPELLKGKAALPNYNVAMTNKIGNKAWHIEFETGSDQISEASASVIEEIYNEITGSDGSKAKLIGYTDNVGNPSANQALSGRRASSVMQRLIQRGLTKDRFFIPEGRGDKDPIADNTSEEGRAQNRRVQISILTQ
jgi:outer membrane protein OmpA-like peptidoglycan-associated protein